jgi:hypothetical protein
MRYDAWSKHVKMTDPDSIVKSAPFEETFSPVEKVWSDEARAAALAARRGRASTAASPAGKPHTHAVMIDGGFDKTFPDKESAKAYADRLRSNSRTGIPFNRPTRATVAKIPTSAGGRSGTFKPSRPEQMPLRPGETRTFPATVNKPLTFKKPKKSEGPRVRE